MSLFEIQQKLKAPKSKFNKFGKYSYRSLEDILEAVKPLLGDAVLTLTDEIVLIGDRYYVKATAIISEGEKFHEVTAYAREEENKKGMDGAQVTGASSSYARKYALNGLFLIDDTKDADSTNQHGKGEEKQADDKPWYNDFDSHKDAMKAAIKSGEKTHDSIIANLEKVFKVSNKSKELIRGL
jgi:hypothetical protein